MKCIDVKGIMGALADGELADARLREEAEAHLRECALCRAEFSAQVEVKRLVAAHPREQASPFLATRVMAEISQRKRARIPARMRWAYSGAAALLLIVAITVGVLMPHGNNIYPTLPKSASQANVSTWSGEFTPVSANFGEFVQQQHEDARDLLRASNELSPDLESTVRELKEGESIYKELPKEKEGSAK
jgi:hypothetical protein